MKDAQENNSQMQTVCKRFEATCCFCGNRSKKRKTSAGYIFERVPNINLIGFEGSEVVSHQSCYRLMKLKSRKNAELKTLSLQEVDSVESGVHDKEPSSIINLQSHFEKGGLNAVRSQAGAFVYTHIPGPLMGTEMATQRALRDKVLHSIVKDMQAEYKLSLKDNDVIKET